MTFDWSVIWEHRSALFNGALMTIMLTVVTMFFAIPGGVLLALARQSSFRPIRFLAAAIIELCRNTPLILVVYWAYYVLPVMAGISFSNLETALVALICYVSAYNAETFRAGINSIRRGQMEAALSLGMSKGRAFRDIILPQALRRVLPVLATTWVALFKDTSLVSVISVAELSHVSLEIRSQTLRVLELMTAMLVIYWLMGYPQAKLTDWIYRRWGEGK